jgi:hypothetical protein
VYDIYSVEIGCVIFWISTPKRIGRQDGRDDMSGT